MFNVHFFQAKYSTQIQANCRLASNCQITPNIYFDEQGTVPWLKKEITAYMARHTQVGMTQTT